MKADDISLRPQYLRQYKGQSVAVSSLRIMIDAAKKRGECLDHVLITGPGGLGKTTLGNCIANEMNVPVKFVTAPNLTSEIDFQQILSSMNEHEVLFIDEIHALSSTMVEMLYTVMEDFYFDGVVKFRNMAQTIRVQLKPFTLIGATTNPEKLTPSLRTRFGLTLALDYMNTMALVDLITESAGRLGLPPGGRAPPRA
jgi:Holliday junction DNA helicase RuvB